MDMFEHMKQYRVEADNLEQFLEMYTQYRAHGARGADYVKARIESHREDLRRFGYTFITQHDSTTGEIVAYYPQREGTNMTNNLRDKIDGHFAAFYDEVTPRVHFKRQGFAELLQLTEMEGTRGDYTHFKIQGGGPRLYMEKVRNSHVVRSGDVGDITTPEGGLNYDRIQREIMFFMGRPVKLGYFIESYYPGAQHSNVAHLNHPEDRDIVQGVDVTDMTVAEMVQATGTRLPEFFANWRPTEAMCEALAQLPPSLSAKRFQDLYLEIHNHSSKADKEAHFMAWMN